MTSRRQEKVSGMIAQYAGAFIQTHASNQALITVTHADVSPDLRRSKIYITTIPEERETQAVAFLNRHAADFRGWIKPKLSMRNIPFFSFELDFGERNRQKITEIASGIDDIQAPPHHLKEEKMKNKQ